ncbi:hypothetical protein BABINDRAFT_166982 [Babjeviella inositovora NRRL Y-12698]|uniref:Uncharacterized protein n=1 Tax=Babjeviella inositovora NRRL Y-12698 TaxID=984486 RepID=A0A1E3QQF8_9ASCO|nr:uncharacterized protein BABINDRAFT_166982 [Babjeviella inositovora NRRL Y-12698]ODQ79878.1 hypothetical protein BABINDRAFT_166982 [Babjeviella inositovora NRRL Y-12698]
MLPVGKRFQTGLLSNVRQLAYTSRLPTSSGVNFSQLLHCTVLTTPTPQTAHEVQYIHQQLKALVESDASLANTKMVHFLNAPTRGKPSFYNEVIFHSNNVEELALLRNKLAPIIGLLRLRTWDYVTDRQTKLTTKLDRTQRPNELTAPSAFGLSFPFKERKYGFLYSHLQISEATMDDPFYHLETGPHISKLTKTEFIAPRHFNYDKAFQVNLEEREDTLKTLQLLQLLPESHELEHTKEEVQKDFAAIFQGFTGFNASAKNTTPPSTTDTMDYLFAADRGEMLPNEAPQPPHKKDVKKINKDRVKNALMKKFLR